jgi:DNA-binding response OmpR family regulator
VLLATREMLLEEMGHKVVSADGFVEAMRHCDEINGESYDLVVLGHSIPPSDKQAMMEKVKTSCDAPVLALLRPHEGPVAGAARSIVSFEPNIFLEAVRQVLAGR